MSGAVEQAGPGVAAAEEAAFDGLPCMALIERRGRVVARNALARAWTGHHAEESTIDEVLLGAYDFGAQDRRYRFDCMLIRRQGAPMQVSVAAHVSEWRGESCRLVLLMERAEGFAGASESDGCFLEDVLNAAPEAMAITHEGRVLHVNREFTRLFEYSERECVGAELDDLVLPDARVQEQAAMLEAVRVDGRAEFETVRQTRSGDWVAVCVVMSRVRLGGGASGMLETYRDIGKQKQNEARLEHAALHDALTGLANRALFHDRLELTLARLRRRPERSFAVVFLDLDGFKNVNDRLGHAAGDGLLKEMARRLLLCLRPQDTVSRFGGDEFALLLDDSGDMDDVNGVLERIQYEMQRPVKLDGCAALNGAEARVSASIGIAMGAAEYESSDEILRDADLAMYQAKAEGKARHVVFGSGTRAALERGGVLGFQHDPQGCEEGGGEQTAEQPGAAARE